MRQFLPLALVTAALAAPAPAADGIKFPLLERSLTNADGTVDEAALLSSLNATLVKYGAAPLPPISTTGNQKRSNVKLTDQVTQGEDELYYGPITIGTTKQTFTIDFDTGSADLFVPGPNCGSSCSGKTKYNQHGQDQHKTTTVTYGSGDISGEDYKDTVTVGGLTVPSQGFISLTNSSGFSSSKADGLMGMGFSTIAQTGYPTFFENLISGGKVSTPAFSFFLGRAKSKTQGQSELTLGGSDSSRFTGSPTSVPVTKKGYWQVALDAVAVNGKSAGAATKGQAAIDTGTTIVLAPTKAAAAIFKKIPGSIPIPLSSGNGVQLYAFPCGSKAVPAITFAGKNFAINPLDFNLGSLSLTSGLLHLAPADSPLRTNPSDAGGYCIAGVGGADLIPNEALYVVGDVFLKNWYSTFSYTTPSVSFAAAKGNQ